MDRPAHGGEAGGVVCDRCRQRPASGFLATVVVSTDGTERGTSERLCSECLAAHRAATEAVMEARRIEREAELDARARDGTLFEELRRDLAAGEATACAEELAQAAAILDNLASALPVPLPDDLRAFADRHRPLSDRGHR